MGLIRKNLNAQLMMIMIGQITYIIVATITYIPYDGLDLGLGFSRV